MNIKAVRVETHSFYAGPADLYLTTITNKILEFSGVTAPNKIITFKRLKKPLTWMDFASAMQSVQCW